MQILIDLFFSRLKNYNSKLNYIKYINVHKEYSSCIESNYLPKWIKTKCLCKIKEDKDILLSLFDRHLTNYQTVICKNCGLIRANYYFKDQELNNFYQNDYRRLTGKEDPEFKYKNTFKRAIRTSRYKIIEKFFSSNNKIIFDIGGASGGMLEPYIKNNTVYLFDYNDDYLNYAKRKNIIVVKGGIQAALDTKITPDLIILNHVIEHFNNFDQEIMNINKLCGYNTIVFIETPGIDSLMRGRRSFDFLGDLQVAHKFYFSKKKFVQIFSNFGFNILHINNNIQSVIKKTNSIKVFNKKNYFYNSIIILLVSELFFILSIIKKKIFK